MSARDDFGSNAGRPGGGGAGGLGNGGLGGGMGGGAGGGGYGGGMTANTGMTTGNTWHGNTAFGQAGGMATGYAMRDARSLGQAGMGPTMGTYGQFKTMAGNPMFGGSPVQGQTFNGYGAGQAFGSAQQAYEAWKAAQAAKAAQSVGGILGGEVVSQPLTRPAMPPAVAPPNYATIYDQPIGPVQPYPGVDMHLGSTVMGPGYNSWSGMGSPPGYQTPAPGKGDFQGGIGAPGKGNLGGGGQFSAPGKGDRR